MRSDTNENRVRHLLSVSRGPEGDSARGDVLEDEFDAALASVNQNKVEAAYTRSDLFERRRLFDGHLSRTPLRPLATYVACHNAKVNPVLPAHRIESTLYSRATELF